MVPCLTLCILSAGILTRRSAVVVKTGSVQGTLTVINTFSSGAGHKWVPSVTCWTGTYRPVCTRSVKPGLALCPWSTWVRCAQVFLFKRSAAYKWVSSVSPRARAHSLVAGSLTGGSLSAYVGVRIVTWVPALQLDTSLVGGAVVVSGTLSIAAGERIAKEVWGTATLCTMVDCLAVGILPACSTSTSILTTIVLTVTCLRLSTLIVRVTFMATSLQRVSNVCWLAATDRAVILSNLTVSVGATRSADLIPGEPPAVSERVPCGAPWTPADSHMVLYSAVSSLATRQATWVNTVVVLASTLRSTV